MAAAMVLNQPLSSLVAGKARVNLARLSRFFDKFSKKPVTFVNIVKVLGWFGPTRRMNGDYP
jgi:hypothetical protein